MTQTRFDWESIIISLLIFVSISFPITVWYFGITV